MNRKTSAHGRFLRLPVRDRLLIAEAVLSVAAVRLALIFLRFCDLLFWLEKASVQFRARSSAERPPSGRIIWAIQAASKWVPNANSCLPRALAARFLLARWGYPAELSIGVAKDGDGKLEAHAWVESLGEVVIGEAQPGYFIPLAAQEAARR